MKKVLLRFCAVFLAITMLISIAPMSVFALTAKEQEDFYRVNTWWQDEYNQQYIDWLLESDNFMYHLDISTGDIIHDMSYGSLNLDPKQRKDNFVGILTSFIGLSYDEIREQSAAEAFSVISVEFLDGFKDFLENTQLYTVDQFKYMEKAISETSDYYLSYYYGIDTDMGEYGYQAIYERIQSAFDNKVQDFDWPDHKGETLQEFYNFVKSSEWHKKLSDVSEVFSIAGETVQLANDGIALIGQLESYNKTDERLVELLKYIRARTTDSALRAACDEIIARFGNSYTVNIIQGILQIAGDMTLEWTFDNVKDLISSHCGIYAIFAKIGITAGNAVSDLWFNTTETKQQMQTIYCLDHISELLVPLLQTELQDLYSYDEASSFRASYAADAIYHMSVLIELRKKGEESYYKLKDSVYGSNIIEACKTLGWGSFADDEQIIEAWYSEFKYVINAVEGSLYKMIPAYYYYEKPEPAEFEKEGSRLIAYNGDSVNVYIPTDVYCNTIDSYAFNGNEIIQSVNIPYTIKTINANAFYNCTNLKSVTINSTEAVIANGAFVNCHKDFTIYGYNNSTAQTYAVANDINFVSLDSEYENAQDYVDSDFTIWGGVLTGYSGKGGVVYIPYGVTVIGSDAFYNCESIESVIIPDTVTQIRSGAFKNCYNLTSVAIPDSVTEIDNCAFENCHSLTNINIPDSLWYLGWRAFENCWSLAYNSYDNALYLGNTNNPYVILMSAKDSDIYECEIHTDTKFIYDYAFYGCADLESITIPNHVAVIGYYAFKRCTNLTSVNMLDGVVNIQDEAFNGCTNLTSVTIPDSVVIIGYDAFRSCTSLATITIPDSVTCIEGGAFASCISLTNIVVPNSVTSIGEGAFAGCRSLESMTLPFVGGNVEPTLDTEHLFGYIFGETRYSGCSATDQYYYSYRVQFVCTYYIPTSLKEVTITGGNILSEAFVNCYGLTAVTIPNGLTRIEPYTFYGCSNLTTVEIPDSVTSIGHYAFGNCDLKNTNIPNSISSIGGYAFSGCNFTSISIPDNVTIIEDNTFENCLLDSVTIPNGVTSIGTEAFYNCNSLTSVDIPNSVRYIGVRAFYGCDSLVSAFIPKSVTYIDSDAFDKCESLTSILVDAENLDYSSDNYGVLYNGDKTSIILVPKAIEGSYTIPDSVTDVGYAFQNCTKLTSLVIGNGISEISYATFYGCSSLTSVTIPNNVTRIGNNAFYNCNSLTSIDIPDNVTRIGEKAFYNCMNLTSITIPDSVTYIANDAFNSCDRLTIICGVGSYAETYAKENDIPFVYDNIKSISISALPSKVVYPTNGILITEGLMLNVVFEDNTQTTVTTGYTIGDYDFSTVGTKCITVTYGGLVVCFEVTVCNHNFGAWLKKSQPTCTTTGEEYRLCSVCAYEETHTIAALGHDYASEWTTDIPATCTTTGSKSHHCLNCEERTDITEIPAAHQWSDEWTIDEDPTCTTGSKSHHCLICDARTDITDISTGHTWSTEWTVDKEETCTTVGSKSHHCLICEEKTDVTVIPVAHQWSDKWTIDVEPSETTEGSKSRHCTRCDAKTDVTIIPMLSTESPATDFEYSIRNNEVRITGYVGTSGRMNIPTYIEGCPVTTIAAFAFSGNATITEATIPYTVTNIEYYAFYNCSELLEVTVGSGVTVLPESAFSRCGKLQKVSLPLGLTKIQNNAFYYCESLVEMAIPDTVEVIEDSAFYECLWYANLSEDTVVGTGILLRLNTEFGEDVVIPDGVHTIYTCSIEDAFTNTYVDQVTLPASMTNWSPFDLHIRASSYIVDEDNKYFTAVNGVIYSKDMSTVVAVPSRMAEELSLSETVTTIGSGAFYSSNLSKITLHKGVIELKEGAFSYCNNLTEITIPDSVISIENNAFRGGNDNLVILCGLGSCAAAYAADNNISFRILATPKELSIASLPSKLTYPIGGTLDLSGLSLYAVYEDGTNATVSTGYTVSDYDFSTAGTKVITVSLGELSVTFEVVVDPSLVVYPESDHPYANNSSQTWSYIHPSGADQLIITFSDDTETENNYDKIYIYDGNGNEVGVYSGAQLAGASIIVDGNKFSIKLTSDSSVTKNGFTVVSVEAIVLCNHSYGEWTERTAPTCATDGLEYRICSICGNEETQVVAKIGHNWEAEWTVDIEPTETSEGSKSRHCINCEATTDVIVIPMLNVSPVEDFVYTVNNNTVTITDYTGTNTTVTIPSSIDGNPVTTIGVYAFADCTDLTKIVIPCSVTVIGNWAFSNCTNLTDITIPDSVTYIGMFAFNNCSNLTGITIGNGVVTIGDSAFSNCTSLISINISRSVANIGNYVFSGCNSLDGIWVDANNPYYSSDDQGVLYNKSKTKLIRVPGGIASVTIPNSVTNIGISSFSYSNVLSNVVIPSSVTSIGEYAFYNCANLKAVYYTGTREQWNTVAISGNNTHLENSVRCIDELSFKGASLSLHHNLAINYKVDKALFAEVGYTNPYVIFEIGGKKTTVKAYAVEGDRYVFRFRNIAPNQMNDTIYATLYATYNGVEYASETREYSVAEYCYSTLNKYASDDYAELRTLLVDLLHYGAQSQLYTKYNVDNLVNANLTEAQLAWGTADDPTLTNSLNTAYETVENPLITWKGASLNLNDSVSMRFKFIAEDIGGLSLKITGETGEWNITANNFVLEDGVYSVRFSGLNAGQMSEKVYLTMYKDGVAVSNTVCYSIESYAYSKQDSTIEHLSDLVKAMMKYGNSAYSYVN